MQIVSRGMKNKKNLINLSPAELAQSVVKVKQSSYVGKSKLATSNQ